MFKFSANLGFLWSELSLPDAIRAAAKAGFDAVECHWPYTVPPQKVKKALEDTGLEMLGLNTSRGNLDLGENGLCALPGRKHNAQQSIDEAIKYAEAIGAKNIHVMAGFAEGREAHHTFLQNLQYACEKSEVVGITILIEALNPFDAPGYFLKNTTQAKAIIAELGISNLKLMFDCYHVARTEGDVLERFLDLQDLIGHIQFASVPDRGAPHHSNLDYKSLFQHFSEAGWNQPFGAEYRSNGPTETSLDWMQIINSA